MEIKISRRLNVVALFALSALSFSANAFDCGSCAKEWTQLTNKIQLIAQVGEAVQTTANTLQTAQATMQQLKQLTPADVLSMTGLPIDKVKKLAEAYQVMSAASSAYKDAKQVLENIRNDSQRLNITPSQLLQMKADVAAAFGGLYKQQYDQEQAKLTRLEEVSRDVQDQATKIQGIDSTVSGIQLLANQNLKMQSMLSDLNHSISTANALAAQANMNAEAANKDKAVADRYSAEDYAANRARQKAEIDSLINMGRH
jgi:hypothetical protein